jgi:hypothetical protein
MTNQFDNGTALKVILVLAIVTGFHEDMGANFQVSAGLNSQFPQFFADV